MKPKIKNLLITLLLVFTSSLSFSQSFQLFPSSLTTGYGSDFATTFWCHNIDFTNGSFVVQYRWNIGNGWMDIYGQPLPPEITTNTNNNTLTLIPMGVCFPNDIRPL